MIPLCVAAMAKILIGVSWRSRARSALSLSDPGRLPRTPPQEAASQTTSVPAPAGSEGPWRRGCLICLLLAFEVMFSAGQAFPQEASQTAVTLYLSPAGNDGNTGRSPEMPLRSFARAFGRMRAGDALILLDGEYSEAAGTGVISYTGGNSGQPPSGLDRAHPTRIRALHPGRVLVSGRLFLGRKSRKDSHIRIEGITFRGGGSLYNTSHVTIAACGFQGSFGIGTNDHHEGNSQNLVEDVWIWTSGERIVAINYRAHRNVWRRVLVRGDGCGTPACAGSGNPNVGISVYDSNSVSLQNVMVVDRVLAPTDSPYADFAVAQHTPDPRYYFGQNEWLGTISLRAPDTGYYMEPDRGQTIDPTIRIANAIAWDSAQLGFNLARSGTNNLLEGLTARAQKGDGIRIAPELQSGTLVNVLVAGAGRYGINSAYPPSHTAVFGASAGAYNQTACKTGCYARNPLTDGTPASLRHLTRIEPGSFLKGRGAGGADIGATVLYRYGVEGTLFGEAGFNTLTAVPLWPWPNEERIAREMCGAADSRRGFCAAGSLSRYVWEYLGNPMPGDVSPRLPPRR